MMSCCCTFRCKVSSNSQETDFMDLEMINVAREGDIDGLKRLHERDPNILLQRATGLGNTLLHLAAKFGHLNFLVEVCDICPSLIPKTNRYRDTALHVGARAGHMPVVNHLIERMASHPSNNKDTILPKNLVGSKNFKGNSALHEALWYCHRDIAKLLIEKDPDLCRIVNGNKESPLYLAVIKGYDEVVDHILHYSPSAAWDCPKGWTVFHACAMVEEEGLGFSMAQKLLQVKPELAEECDNFKRTSLHYAVDMNKPSIVRLLLQHRPSLVYSGDCRGWSPLHVAAYQSYEGPLEVSIIDDIIQYCPDWEYLRDFEGNNVLHVLMERMDEVVREGDPSDQVFRKLIASDELLNGRNRDGNTPLHIATLYKREYFKRILAEDPRVDKKARNNKNLTASDIARYEDYKSQRQKDITRRSTWEEIHSNISPNDQPLLSSEPPLWIETLDPDFCKEVVHKEDVEDDLDEEIHKKLSKTHMLVATLIATVAFAAALQIPGGYEQSTGKEGMAVLAGQAAFGAFVVSDVLALSCSVLTLLLYFLGEVNDPLKPRKFFTVKTSLILIAIAIVAMIVAFMCGVFAVLVKTHSLSIGIVTILVCLSVPFLACFLTWKSRACRFLTMEACM